MMDRGAMWMRMEGGAGSSLTTALFGRLGGGGAGDRLGALIKMCGSVGQFIGCYE